MDPQALAESRGRLGVLMFDSRIPEWFQKITEAIRVGSQKKCPLAQIYGTYRDGRFALGLSDEDALAHGFRADSREFNYDRKAVELYYEHLSAIFNREVERRLQVVQ